MHPDTMAAITVHSDHRYPHREDVALGVAQKNQRGAACPTALIIFRERFLVAMALTFRRKRRFLGTCTSVRSANCFLSAALSETATAPERAPFLQLDKGG
jgi:hypothetical protein